MKIAVITGASSGIGKKFAEELSSRFTFDEVWLIARRKNELESLAETLPYKTRVIDADLTKDETKEKYKELLSQLNPEIELLINCSGFGKFCATDDVDVDVNLNMVDLNCKAVLYMCQLSLPYMKSGARIINVASVAAFQPIPYINVYAATKAFVLSFSRALNRELKKRKISVTAVCPFWTKTEFFNRAVKEGEEKVVKKYVAMYDPKDIVRRAYKDAIRRKDVSKYGFIARFQAGLCKILPHSLIMNIWQSQQKLK